MDLIQKMGRERGMNIRPPVLVRDFRNPHPEVDLNRIKELHPKIELILVVLPRHGDYYRKYCTLVGKWPPDLKVGPLHCSLRPSANTTVLERLQTFSYSQMWTLYIHPSILEGLLYTSMHMLYSPSGLSPNHSVMCSISAWSFDYVDVLLDSILGQSRPEPRWTPTLAGNAFIYY